MQASAPSDQYLCAFILCVLLIFFLYFEQFLDFRFTRRPYCLFIIVCYRSAVGASIRQFLSREAVAAGIAKVVVQVIFTPISNISSNAIMVGSSLPVSFINPVYIRSSLLIASTAWCITASPTMKRIEKSEKIHGKVGGWCRTAIRRLSAGNCLMKFPHYGKPSKQSRKSEKSGADSAERIIRIFSKAEYFAKSAAKIWFAIGKVMVHCIFTVNSAMFQSQRKTSGTASIRKRKFSCKNTRFMVS